MLLFSKHTDVNLSTRMSIWATTLKLNVHSRKKLLNRSKLFAALAELTVTQRSLKTLPCAHVEQGLICLLRVLLLNWTHPSSRCQNETSDLSTMNVCSNEECFILNWRFAHHLPAKKPQVNRLQAMTAPLNTKTMTRTHMLPDWAWASTPTWLRCEVQRINFNALFKVDPQGRPLRYLWGWPLRSTLKITLELTLKVYR